MLEDDQAKIESANFILLVKLGSRAAIGYYPLRERGAANIRIREYQYREYRGPIVYLFYFQGLLPMYYHLVSNK